MTSLKVFSLPGSADDDDDATSSDDSFDADVDDVTRPQSNMFRSHTQSVAKHMGLTVLDGANGGREKGANSDQLTTLHSNSNRRDTFRACFSEATQESATQQQARLQSLQHRLQLQRRDVTARTQGAGSASGGWRRAGATCQPRSVGSEC